MQNFMHNGRLSEDTILMKTWIREWWQSISRHLYIIVPFIALLLLLFILLTIGYFGYWRHVGWIGFAGGDNKVTKIISITGGIQAEEYPPTKTLWDWMTLLIIPIVLAGGGYIFSTVTKRNAEKIAEDNRQEEALRSYFGKMSELLVKNDVHEQKNVPIQVLVRAYTLNILRMVRTEHKSYVIQFLIEAGLINMLTAKASNLSGANLSRAKLDHIKLPKAWLHEIDFDDADLSSANFNGAELHDCTFRRANLSWCMLRGAWMSGVNLIRANLRGADLSGAYLSDSGRSDLDGAYVDDSDLNGAYIDNDEYFEVADLSHANLGPIIVRRIVVTVTKLCKAHLQGVILEHANLTSADLSGADLSHAHLKKANLSDADLRGADLSDADLTGACLKRANLTGAKGVTQEQLRKAKSCKGAVMPDGSPYNG